jgi:hypothetical protein
MVLIQIVLFSVFPDGKRRDKKYLLTNPEEKWYHWQLKNVNRNDNLENQYVIFTIVAPKPN